MRIVNVIHVCSAGGAEIFVKNMTINNKKLFPNNDYELWVLHNASDIYGENNDKALLFEKDYIKELNDNNISVKIIGKNKMNRFQFYKAIRRLNSSFKPDIIHCHLESVTINVVLALLFNKVNIIETIHNVKIKYKKIHKYLINKKIKYMISIADTVTKSINKEIKINSKKLIQIYNGVDINKFKCNRKFNEKKKKNIVLIGRLTEQKNYFYLLRNVQTINEICSNNNIDIPNINIYGQGELEKNIINYLVSHDIKNVYLCGISNDIANVLSKNDIYLMCSKYEGFSISLIEALSSGISIVCTDVGGNKEIIGNNCGILIECDNDKQLVDSILKMLKNDKLREKYFKNCRSKANNFSLDKCCTEHNKLYFKVGSIKWELKMPWKILLAHYFFN